MRIEFTRAAIVRLDAIEAYVRLRNPAAAARIAKAVEGATDFLLQFSESGRRQEQDGVRRIIVRPGRTVIYYRVLRPIDIVRILAIVHPSRRRRCGDL